MCASFGDRDRVLELLEKSFFGSLAQSVEQLAFNQLVVRSNRTRPTIFASYGIEVVRSRKFG